jgi:hypothetical protein
LRSMNSSGFPLLVSIKSLPWSLSSRNMDIQIEYLFN